MQKDELRGGNLRTGKECLFGRCIDDFFVFEGRQKKLMKAYDCVYSAFVRRKLPPIPTKFRLPEKTIDRFGRCFQQ